MYKKQTYEWSLTQVIITLLAVLLLFLFPTCYSEIAHSYSAGKLRLFVEWYLRAQVVYIILLP